MNDVPNAQLAPPGWLDAVIVAAALLLLVGLGVLIGVWL